jgi:hypothetical protein
MTRIFACAVIALVLNAGIQGQDVLNGKWQGETPNGAQLELDIAVKKAALVGTLTRNAQPTPIVDGRVTKKGDKPTVTFKATLNDQTESFTGEVEGDQMKVWLDRQGPETAVVLKRLKANK